MDIDKLKQLREETGVSFSLCKKALDESEESIDQAKKILTRWGIEKAEGKADRETKEGAIFSYIHHNKKIGVLVEVLCETDFVARNDDFQNLGRDISLQIASTNPENNETLFGQEFIKDPSKTIDQIIKEAILKIGENITIGKFTRFSLL